MSTNQVVQSSCDSHVSFHQATPSDAVVKKNSEGENYVELGKNKRATVRLFKGIPLIDIREFYTDKASGEDKPGKKGLSLGLDQVCCPNIYQVP